MIIKAFLELVTFKIYLSYSETVKIIYTKFSNLDDQRLLVYYGLFITISVKRNQKKFLLLYTRIQEMCQI